MSRQQCAEEYGDTTNATSSVRDDSLTQKRPTGMIPMGLFIMVCGVWNSGDHQSRGLYVSVADSLVRLFGYKRPAFAGLDRVGLLQGLRAALFNSRSDDPVQRLNL